MSRTSQELIHLHGTGNFKESSVKLKVGEIAVRNAEKKEDVALYAVASNGEDKVKFVNEYELSAFTAEFDGMLDAFSAATVDALNDLEAAAAASAKTLDEKIEGLSAGTKDEIAALSANVIDYVDDVVASANTDLTALSGAVKEFSAATDAALDDLNDKLEAVSAASFAADEKLAGDIEDLDGKLDDFSGEVKTRLEALEQADKDIYEAISGLSGNVIEYVDAAILSANTDVKELSGAVEAFSSATVDALEELEGKAAASAKTLDDKIEAVSAASFAADEELAGDIDELSGVVAAFSSATVDALDALDTKVEELSSATKAEVARLDGRIDTVVSATVKDVHYSSETKKIYLEKEDGTLTDGFDASAFIVDGMLSSVTYNQSAHTMTFTWNTDAGTEPVTINLDEIISPYTGDGKTIALGENNTFSAIMDVEEGVASYDLLVDFSGEVKSEIEALDTKVGEFSSATVDALEELERKAAESADTLDAKIDAVSGASAAADKELAADIEALQDADEALYAAISGLSGNVIDYVDAAIEEAQGDLTELSGAVRELSSATEAEVARLEGLLISGVTVNNVVAEVENNMATVTIDGEDIEVGKAITYSGETIVESTDTVAAAIEKFFTEMEENEEVTAAALNDLDTRVKALEDDGSVAELSGVVKTFSAATEAALSELEAKAAASAKTLDDKIEETKLDSLVIENLSGVTGTYAVENNTVTVDFANMIIDCGTYDE